MEKYSVYFTINGSVDIKAQNEGEAIKKFWEDENRVLINNMARHRRVNMEELTVEPQEAVLKIELPKKTKLFGKG